MPLIRLNKFLATAGIASRRRADEMIKAGEVKINGKVSTEVGVRIDSEADVIEVNNQTVELKQPRVTYLLNKPRSVICTADDPEGRPTVLDFVPNFPRVFPCGRLDEETEGLLLLTNDGELCYQLTHPKFEHQKEYVVTGRTKDPYKALDKLTNGVTLNDGPAKPDKVSDVVVDGQKVKFTIIIHEGRNRIVRRMCAAVSIQIDSLTRIRVGSYTLGDIQPGKYRQLD